MKITARASGGFAGGSDCFELDTGGGGGGDGAAVEALLDRLDFFGAAPPAAIGADLMRWEITVDDGRRCRTVVLHDDGGLDAAGWPALFAHLRAGGRTPGA